KVLENERIPARLNVVRHGADAKARQPGQSAYHPLRNLFPAFQDRRKLPELMQPDRRGQRMDPELQSHPGYREFRERMSWRNLVSAATVIMTEGQRPVEHLRVLEHDGSALPRRNRLLCLHADGSCVREAA